MDATLEQLLNRLFELARERDHLTEALKQSAAVLLERDALAAELDALKQGQAS